MVSFGTSDAIERSCQQSRSRETGRERRGGEWRGEWGKGSESRHEVEGPLYPRSFITSCRKGVREGKKNGPGRQRLHRRRLQSSISSSSFD